MATIANAKLELKPRPASGTVKCTATAKVNFTTLERSLMQQGLRFRLKCELWGPDDNITHTDEDNRLFVYEDVYNYPGDEEVAEFVDAVASGVLNEDDPTWLEKLAGVSDRDEIYAYFTLINLETNAKITQKSNEVHGEF